ncbi:MAG TPA: ABC transporter permease [Nitrososphaerales archaeon]|nr:ABC transporter permease [Nitrososphaerales archaeon]
MTVAETIRKQLVQSTTRQIIFSSVTGTIGAVIAMGFVVIAVVMAITGKSLLPYNPLGIHLQEALQAPSAAHWFGTDSLGRDEFSRVLAAFPIDALVSFTVVLSALVLGLIMGALAGYRGGLVEEVLMRVTDIFLAFPGLVLALAIAIDLGPNTYNSILALTPVWWPYYTRLARGEALNLKSQDFVLASRAVGQSTAHIVFRHIIPGILPVMLVYATLDVGNVLITFSVLSFIGVGAQPPAPELGLMVVEDLQYLLQAPWVVLAPSLVIFAIAISYSMFGDKLRDALDPRVRGLHN